MPNRGTISTALITNATITLYSAAVSPHTAAMQLYFRLLWTLLYCWRQPRLSITDPVPLSLKVLPTDLDLNKHMNNSRYLALMDLGRVAFMARTGLLGTVWQRKWSPIVAEIDINFYKALAPFEQFTLTTQIASYDHKYFYLTQSFYKIADDTHILAAEAHVKGLFISGRGKVSSADVIAAYGETHDITALQAMAKRSKT